MIGNTKRMTRILMGLMSAAMLVTVMAPAQADASSQPYYYVVGSGSPCPNFSVQQVLADPNSDWDYDRITNVTELYNGMNPCITDTSGYCATFPSACNQTLPAPCSGTGYHQWTWYQVNSDPFGDWDHDGVNNRDEANWGARPCQKPCPYPRSIDVSLNPHGDWDRDGLSNSIEVYRGTDPCNSHSLNPCPYYSHYQVNYMPYADWDGDGISNVDEVRRGYNPCVANYTQRLPHVSTAVPYGHQAPAVVTHSPPLQANCPYGYPYFHPGTGLCYANPIGRHY